MTPAPSPHKILIGGGVELWPKVAVGSGCGSRSAHIWKPMLHTIATDTPYLSEWQVRRNFTEMATNDRAFLRSGGLSRWLRVLQIPISLSEFTLHDVLGGTSTAPNIARQLGGDVSRIG